MAAAPPPPPPVLGILMLDNAFERYVGDLGNPATFAFPVLYETTPGATTHAITTLADDRFLDPFADAATRLVARGSTAIVTSCGFLALYQRALAARLPVPVATSALLQCAWLAPLLPHGRRVGVLTFDATSLTATHLTAVGADPSTPIVGLPQHGNFRRALLGEAVPDCYEIREQEAVASARQLVHDHPSLGAIVLECTNLAPHARAIRDATGLPVYDIMTLVSWFHTGLAQRHWPRP